MTPRFRIEGIIGEGEANGAGFREKMVAGICAKLDPKGEHSVMARDGAQFTLAEMAMSVCRMQGLRPFNEVEGCAWRRTPPVTSC